MSVDVTEKIAVWIEREIGGRVSSCVPQGRWRDAWFVTLEKDGISTDIYVRGDRNEEFPPDPLEYEAAVFDTLRKSGIAVPRVYGICPDPHAIVMECTPGRANLATAESEAERVAVLEHLGDIMADMHALDPAPFAAAGMRMPVNDRESTLPYVVACETIYRRHADRIDPRVEFLLRWLERHRPAPPERLSFTQQDSGQFLFDKGRVTALLDMELAAIADPLIDIAAIRQRAVAEPMGDLRPLLRRYIARSGLPLDRQRIAYHSASWLIGSSVLIGPSLSHPKHETNFPEYLSWYIGCMSSGLQAITEHDGYTLPEPDEETVSAPSRWSVAIDLLRMRTGEPGGEDYPSRLNGTISRFVANIDSIGGWTEARYIDDLVALTGTRATTGVEADALFARFVETAGPEQDRPIVEMIHRWLCRQARLIEGLDTSPFGRMMPIDDLLDL
jgi:aminoglycoside phosphotransferase (APT) family kinase protein